jgi:hypothetical protein
MNRKPVHEQVAEQIAGSSPQIEKGVVDHLVKRQLDKRVDALVKVYDDVDRLRLDLRKMKPDLVSCNEAGDVIESNWTPSAAKARKELSDKIEKYQRAIDKAHDKNDFADVFNLANNSKGENT